MRRPNLLDRVMGALLLEPMAPSQLARMLCVEESEARDALQELQARGQVQLLSSRKAWIRAPRVRRAA